MGKRAFVLVACALLTVPVFAQEKPNTNAVGTWKMNLQKTTADPKPKSMVVQVTEDTPTAVKYSFTVVSADGKTSHGAYDAATDGQQHDLTGTSIYKSAAYSRDNGTIHGTLTTQDGNTITQEITFSDDGKIMTIQAKSGDKSWTDVYDRVGVGKKKAAAKKSTQSGN